VDCLVILQGAVLDSLLVIQVAAVVEVDMPVAAEQVMVHLDMVVEVEMDMCLQQYLYHQLGKVALLVVILQLGDKMVNLVQLEFL